MEEMGLRARPYICGRVTGIAVPMTAVGKQFLFWASAESGEQNMDKDDFSCSVRDLRQDVIGTQTYLLELSYPASTRALFIS